METKRTNITKEFLRSFISESAKTFNVSVATYLENRAHRNYVVIDGYRPVQWEDGSLMVLNNKELALEEAKEYEKGKIMTEYDYYATRGVFSSAA